MNIHGDVRVGVSDVVSLPASATVASAAAATTAALKSTLLDVGIFNIDIVAVVSVIVFTSVLIFLDFFGANARSR